MAEKPNITDDPDSMLETAAQLARTLIPEVERRIAELNESLAKAMDQLDRLKQIERIASGDRPTAQNTSRMPPPIRRSLRRQFNPDDGPVPEDDTKDGATTQQDMDEVLERAERPLTVAEIRDLIEERFKRVRAPSTIYNYLGKGKAAGLYTNDDEGWSLTDKGRQALSLF